MRFSLVLMFILGSILVGCGGQSGGIAPSNEDIEQPQTVTEDSDNLMRYGETVVTSGGWEIAMSTVDPVEQVILGNGWEVEVRHE